MADRNIISDGVATQGQRRQVTVLFTDVADFTPLAERLGEELSFQLMQKISAEMMEAVQQHGGTVQDFTGDGVMALFGAPRAMEDAPLRACEAALEIQKRLLGQESAWYAEFGAKPTARIGIHAGFLVVGEIGQGKGSQVTVIGDTVNMASRLESVAAPGEINISEFLYQLVDGRVQATDLGMRTLKGKSKEARVYRLDEVMAATSRFEVSRRRGLTNFVERERELKLLDSCWENAQAGCIQAVQVTGEAGIGKSRLLHEFRKRLTIDQQFILAGDCRANSGAAFEPFIEVVRRSFRISSEDDNASAEEKLIDGLENLGLSDSDALPYLLGLLGLDPASGNFKVLDAEMVGIRTREALLNLLWRCCGDNPVVLFVEDLHWIDSSSQDLIERIVTADEKKKLLVICSFRPSYYSQWSDRANVTDILLDPLSRDGTISLLSERLGASDIAGELVRLVVEKAEGNPLFAEEIANYLREKRQVAGQHLIGAEEAMLPASLQNLLMDRFDQLKDGPRLVLQIAAIAGRKISKSLLRIVVAHECNVDVCLAELENQEFILPVRDPDADYVFKHALVQDAIYSTLMTARRRELHGLVADALEELYGSRREEIADTLALHYDVAGNGEKAVTYLTKAGRKSLFLFSLDEADRHFSRAVDLMEAEGAEPDPKIYIETISIWMDVLFWRSELNRTIEVVLSRLERLEESRGTKFYARTLAFYGVAFVFLMDLQKARKFMDISRSISEDIDDKESLGISLLGMIFAACLNPQPGFSGNIDNMIDELSNLPEIDQNLFISTNINFLISWREMLAGNLDEVKKVATKSVDFGRQMSYPAAVGYGYFWIAFHAAASGEFNVAEQYSKTGLESSGGLVDGLLCNGVRGLSMTFAIGPDRALKLLGNVRKDMFEKGFVSLTNIVDIPIGVAKVLNGDIASGVRWLNKTISFMKINGNTHAYANGNLVLGELYLQLATSEQKPSLSVVLRNFIFLLRTIPFAKRMALRHLNEAIRVGREIGFDGIVAQSMMNAGLVHKASGNLSQAKCCLSEAQKVASTVKWQYLNERIAAELRAIGIS